jgi:hypothetical protein
MAIKFNRSQTFATNGTVTAAGLHNLIDGTDIYQALITDQTNLTSVGSGDELLIADADLTANDAPRAVTVNELFEDALTISTYTNANINNISYGTSTGTRLVSTNASITTGTIPNLTSSTANITNGTIQTLTSSTATTTTLVATTLITTGTGTAATPAISPTGDTNTGVFFPAADTIAATTQGTERLRIDSSGRVGIGTSSPARLLTVDNATNPEIGIYTSGTERVKFSTGGSATSQLVVDLGGAERLRIDSSGRVGIGTTQMASSFADLHIFKAGGSTIRLDRTGSGTCTIQSAETGVGERDLTLSANTLLLNTAATERLRIDASGNVGIGTTSPQRRLHAEDSANSIVGRFSSGQTSSWIQFAASETGTAGRIGCPTNDNAASVAIMTNDTERLRIDSSGNCSIGTATALSTLHVHGNVTLSNTTTATSAGTGGLSKPATYAGYLTVSINGTSRKIPYYAT